LGIHQVKKKKGRRRDDRGRSSGNSTEVRKKRGAGRLKGKGFPVREKNIQERPGERGLHAGRLLQAGGNQG